MESEFAIWGIPPNAQEETLLAAMPHGKPITTRAHAERIKAELEKKHACKAVRIQEIDGTLPAFIKGVK